MAIISIFWGTIAGISANITQYVITSSAPDAPDLSNGIFLSAVNSGTTIGTFIGGIFITTLGSNYVIVVGILACAINILFILIRNKSFKKQDNIS
jgi:predicted MFS family arabinose efflux permease